MSGVRRVREYLAEGERSSASSWAAAYAENRIGEALAYVDEEMAPRTRAALQDAAAVLAALGESTETAAAALAAEQGKGR